MLYALCFPSNSRRDESLLPALKLHGSPTLLQEREHTDISCTVTHDLI